MNDERTPVPRELPAEDLARRCDPERFRFETTADLEDTTDFVGQDRAIRAVRFAVGMRADGFNIYALGSEEIDRRSLVRHFLEERARAEPPPPDVCYVNNFDDPYAPRVLRLPAGTGAEAAKALDEALQELSSALESAFESEQYQTRRQGVQEEAGEEQQEAFEQLDEHAREQGLTLIRTPMGFVFAPVRDGEVVPPDEMDQISEEEQKRLRAAIEELQKELQKILRQMPHHQRRVREQVGELNREIARLTVDDLFGPLRQRFAEHAAIIEHLDGVEENIVHNVRRVVGGAQEEEQQQQQLLTAGLGSGARTSALERPELRPYRIHVIVDHSDSEHAPVIYQDMPTFQNLVGRVEHLPVMGALITDFNLIKSGALHQADGGYLIVDAYRLLTQPFAWEGLKRALQSGRVRIESPREALGLISTVTLDPEPMPLDVKVVLVGSPLLYYLLSYHDPDFGDLFRVEADFDERMDRTEESETGYARLVAGLAAQHDLRPFDRGAVARIVDRSARLVGDSGKLSVLGRHIRNLTCEADHWAGEEGAEVVTAAHVQRAVEEATYRSSRIRDRIQEEIERGTIYIDTEGSHVGQVNGLSVVQLGDFAFGKPSRITARIRLGKGEVVDIEREVELSGPIHSKGVLILTGFLGARYAPDRPLALAASLVFEQSYGGVDGDSASSPELYALLSAIGEVPLDQSMAVTGSINQHGRIQPIGGVNEKIEGFFDVCSRQGLTGRQGVLIPAANVRHLMLRDDVVDAVREGRFHVWPVETVDQGMRLLTGLPMGERDAAGRYPEGSVNARVEARLVELAEQARKFASGGGGGPEGQPDPAGGGGA
ncbi:MAG: ATP-binding protein [Acidobacteriota bacterium]